MGDQLVLICGVICGVVFGIGFLRGYGFLQMLRMGVSLAAAAVPEGLPAAATVNFALGIKNLRKHHVLIRHLQAVETLGAVQTVCLDKTGTLTQNRISVLKLFAGMGHIEFQNGHVVRNGVSIDPLGQEELKQLIHACVLCNETKIDMKGNDGNYELSGSPTENALVHFALRTGVDVSQVRREHRLLKVNYRAENRLFMSTLHKTSDQKQSFRRKGRPRRSFGPCVSGR